MTDSTFDHCAAYAAGGAASEFAEWLYGTSEDDWGGDGALYLELLDVNFRNRYAEIEANARVRRHVEARRPGHLARLSAVRLAHGLIAGTIDADVACGELCRIYYDEGVAEVGAEWIGYDGLDASGMQSEAVRAAIVADARALLAAVDPDQKLLRSSAGAGNVGSHDRHS